MGLRMQSYKKFFIPYYPKADINYIYLLSLYKIAERAEERDIKQDIGYSSIKELLNNVQRYSIVNIGNYITGVYSFKYFQINIFKFNQILLKN